MFFKKYTPKISLFIVIFSFLFSIFTFKSYAHEAYVLTPDQFYEGLQAYTKNPLNGLLDTSHIGLTIVITILVMLTYLIVILWSTTKLAASLDKLVKKLAVIGPLLVRLAVSSSFLYAASGNEILGPELLLSSVPGGEIIRIILFGLGISILFGFLTELAGFISIIIFFYISRIYGLYLVTYANYLGEFLVLMFFGSRFLSIDLILFGKKRFFSGIEKYKWLEIPIVRILYGIALIYAGWTIKFVHQDLTILVYNEYNLKQFFRASAEFIASGAGLSELLIGFFILIGFAQRLTVLISLFFITLSILYFKELVWPHFLLYGISLSLIINSADPLTLDRYLISWVRKMTKRVFAR